MLQHFKEQIHLHTQRTRQTSFAHQNGDLRVANYSGGQFQKCTLTVNIVALFREKYHKRTTFSVAVGHFCEGFLRFVPLQPL